MIIDLKDLYYNLKDKILIDDVVNIPEIYLKNTDIRKISDVRINGYIYEVNDKYNLNLNIKGKMVLPCARTLKDVLYPFNITIDEEIDENNNEYYKIIKNTLDIFPIVWQNIVMEVPLRVIDPDSKDIPLTKGDGWILQSDDNKKEEIDPMLSKLKDFISE